MTISPLTINSSEVFVLTDQKLSELKLAAKSSPANRARINIHRRSDDLVQEMVIALTKNCIFQPHRHRNKSESFHIIEGEMFIMLFNNDGKLTDLILLSALAQQAKNCDFKIGRYYRLDAPHWHSVLPITELVIFHETTTGPFIQGHHEFAPFIEGDNTKINQFYREVLSGIKGLQKKFIK